MALTLLRSALDPQASTTVAHDPNSSSKQETSGSDKVADVATQVEILSLNTRLDPPQLLTMSDGSAVVLWTPAGEVGADI